MERSTEEYPRWIIVRNEDARYFNKWPEETKSPRYSKKQRKATRYTSWEEAKVDADYLRVFDRSPVRVVKLVPSPHRPFLDAKRAIEDMDVQIAKLEKTVAMVVRLVRGDAP